MTDLREAVAAAWFESSALGKSIGFDHAPEAAKKDIRGLMDKLFKAIEAAGYAVVKKEPDDAMLWAACAAHDFPSVYMGGPRLGWAPTAKRVYRSMLEAAASPPLAKET